MNADTQMCIYFSAEAIQNAAGLGLHYVDGKPKWDLTCNVKIREITVSLTLWSSLEHVTDFDAFYQLHLPYY